MVDPTRPQKIVILGGGVGAMTTAFELTEVPEWEQHYEITVYQMGWRLGGKGASGRNQKIADRIEEHGLHLWFGYYENAFSLMQRAYKAVGRDPGQPLATWQDAFHKHSGIVLEQFTDGRWVHWPEVVPENGQVPGDGKIPTLWEVFDRVLEFLHGHIETRGKELFKIGGGCLAPILGSLVAKGEHALADELAHLEAAREMVQARVTGASIGTDHSSLLDRIEKCRGGFMGKVARELGGAIDREIHHHPELLRLVEIVELGLASLKGILADDVINRGFDQLDVYDYREWLQKHGAGKIGINSTLIRTAYETIFAYVEGDTERPNLAAGTALRGLLRLIFTYKGAIMWKMEAGMGDTIFAPLYLALKQRGVRFEFFHKVKELDLSPDGARIGKVTMERQVKLQVPEYHPLYPVNDLPCWPSTPLYDQIDPQQARLLQDNDVNLESHWADWKGEEFPLLEGRDFDLVVMGISLGAVPVVCQPLIHHSQRWAEMVDKVPTIQTQAFQMWTSPDLAALGWDVKKHGRLIRPVLGGYAQPMNTWADMSHLLPREHWPAGKQPGCISYFCGPMQGPVKVPPVSERQFPEQQTRQVRVTSVQWVRDNIEHLWPRSAGAGFEEGFHWELLVDLEEPPRQGVERFDSQFWRANVDPSERYVLSVKNSLQHRIHPGDTGFENLVAAGDWTYNGLNYGCVEAAVISGMLATRALTARFGSTFPRVIYGEDGWLWSETHE